MKQLILAAALAACFSIDALAADTSVDEVVIVDGAYDWSGFYVGANIGHGRADSEYSFFNLNVGQPDGPEIGDDFGGSGDGILGGLQLGFNVQNDRLVLGVEADLQFADISQSTHKLYRPFNVTDFDLNLGFDVNWLSTVRGRLGILATDRLLLYGTAGIAIGEIQTNFSWQNDPIFGGPYGASDSSSFTRTGGAVGAGAEYAFSDNWSLKLEYLYVDFGKDRDVVIDLEPQFLKRNIDGDFSLETVRLGVNYKF